MAIEAEEAPGVPIDDTREISNYIAAMDHGLRRLCEDFPLSLRLIREIHAILLSKGRGQDKDLGEFRQSQNWIGGSRPGNALFVPPPPHLLMKCLGDLGIFIHTDTPDLPLLVKAALVHVQFETIHPFLDGNGRLCRLLVTFLMCEHGVLREPLLYLSLFFKQNRAAYYEHLQAVRERGEWPSGRHSLAAPPVPAATGTDNYQGASRHLGLSQPTVTSGLSHLQALGIVRETTGRQRGRVFIYGAFLDLLNEGTDPLPR